jgi:hypothetical protein
MLYKLYCNNFSWFEGTRTYDICLLESGRIIDGHTIGVVDCDLYQRERTRVRMTNAIALIVRAYGV